MGRPNKRDGRRVLTWSATLPGSTIDGTWHGGTTQHDATMHPLCLLQGARADAIPRVHRPYSHLLQCSAAYGNNAFTQF